MIKLKYSNIVAYLSIGLIFVIQLILFAVIRNTSLTYKISSNYINISYMLLIFNVLIGVLTFSFLILITSQFKKTEIEQKEIIELRNNEIKNLLNMNKPKEEIINDQKQYNIDENLAKLIPKETIENSSIESYTEEILHNFAHVLEIVQGLFFIKDSKTEEFKYCSQYAYFSDQNPASFNLGEGLSGQVAKNKEILIINEIPDNYITIFSGLGKSNPTYLAIIPVVYKNKTLAIIELASFKMFDENKFNLIEKFSQEIAENINNLVKVQNN